MSKPTPEKKSVPISDAKRAWFQKRNKERKDRYNTDPAYREDEKRKYRERYRRNRATKALKCCLDNLLDLEDIGSVREVSNDGMVFTGLCFTIPEIAEALCMSESGLRKAFVPGRVVDVAALPAPILKAKVLQPGKAVGRWQYAYIVEELRAVMSLLGEHQKEYAYLSATKYPEVVAAISAAVDAVREEHFITG